MVVVIGCLLIGYGAFLQTNITIDHIYSDLLYSQLLKGFGAQFLWIGNQYICLASIPLNKVKNASSMFNLILRLGAATFIALSSNIFTKLKNIFIRKLLFLKKLVSIILIMIFQSIEKYILYLLKEKA